MKIQSCVALCAGLLVITAGLAHAQRAQITVSCRGEVIASSERPLGQQTPSQSSSTSTKLYSPTMIKTADGEGFQCSFIVPPNYDSTGDPPVITFFGWVPPNEGCGIVACTVANDVRWKIGHRV